MHWQPIHQICNPCLVTYDYITKLETINQDSEYLLEKLDARSVGSFPVSNDRGKDKSGPPVSNQVAYQKYLEKILQPYKTIEKSTLRKIYQIYKYDFLMFGYDPKPFIELFEA